MTESFDCQGGTRFAQDKRQEAVPGLETRWEEHRRPRRMPRAFFLEAGCWAAKIRPDRIPRFLMQQLGRAVHGLGCTFADPLRPYLHGPLPLTVLAVQDIEPLTQEFI